VFFHTLEARFNTQFDGPGEMWAALGEPGKPRNPLPEGEDEDEGE